MEANIVSISEKDDPNGYGYCEIVVTISYRHYRAQEPRRKDFVYPWMESEGREEDLRIAEEAFKEYHLAWYLNEKERLAHNNQVNALRTGQVEIRQRPFEPQEIGVLEVP